MSLSSPLAYFQTLFPKPEFVSASGTNLASKRGHIGGCWVSSPVSSGFIPVGTKHLFTNFGLV